MKTGIRYWGLGLAALALLAAPGAKAQTPCTTPCMAGDAPPDIVFCDTFVNTIDAIINGDLGELLPPEFASFLNFLDPDLADINGPFRIDDSGDALIIEIFGNGILDASNELGLISAILNDPTFDNGVLTHAEVLAAWQANYCQIRADVGNDTLDGRINLVQTLGLLFPEVIPLFDILAGYLTIGDGNFTVTSGTMPDEPIVVSGEGSFGFVGAIFSFLNTLLADLLKKDLSKFEGQIPKSVLDDLLALQKTTNKQTLQLCNANLQKEDYVIIPELQSTGDADGDGFTNICEARGFAQPNCTGTKGVTPYTEAALSASITPNGCFEIENECTIPLLGSNVVPPVTTDASGAARIQILKNDTTTELRYLIEANSLVVNPIALEILEGAEGVNSTEEPLVSLSPATIPARFELTQQQFDSFATVDAYVVITSEEFIANPGTEDEEVFPGYPDGEIRGQLDCNFVSECELLGVDLLTPPEIVVIDAGETTADVDFTSALTFESGTCVPPVLEPGDVTVTYAIEDQFSQDANQFENDFLVNQAVPVGEFTVDVTATLGETGVMGSFPLTVRERICPITEVTTILPEDIVVLGDGVTTGDVRFEAEVAFDDSGDPCVVPDLEFDSVNGGPIQVTYEIESVFTGVSTRGALNYARVASLDVGVYEVTTTATVVETGDSVSETRTVSVVETLPCPIQSVELAEPTGFILIPDGETMTDVILRANVALDESVEDCEPASLDFNANTGGPIEVNYFSPGVFDETTTRGRTQFGRTATGLVAGEYPVTITATLVATGQSVQSESSIIVLDVPPLHSADFMQPFNEITLEELLRVIQLFNTETGYSCFVENGKQVENEDGFVPGDGDRTCVNHASDYAPADFFINLSELLRAIQFFNADAFVEFCGELGEDNFCLTPGLGEGEGGV